MWENNYFYKIDNFKYKKAGFFLYSFIDVYRFLNKIFYLICQKNPYMNS
jgi:hypothetical protein